MKITQTMPTTCAHTTGVEQHAFTEKYYNISLQLVILITSSK